MASSTRKWRKRQKEYNRRRRQVTRRREQQERNIAEKQRKNRTILALGLTAAQGFNKNVLSKVLETSKEAQTNYLTTTLREKRLADKMKAYFQDFEKERDTSYLHYAIHKLDPFVIKYLIRQGGVNVNEKNIFHSTPLKSLLHTLQRNLQEKVRGTMEYHRQFSEKLAEKQKRIDVIMQIIDILVKAGATLSPDILVAFWGTGAQIETFLELYPQLVQLSFVHKDEILKELKRSLEITEADMDDERQEFHRGWGYGYVPQYLKDQREMEEYSLETFKAFLRSYDPDTGMYNLFNEGTGWNNNYQNQYYEDE